MITRNPETGQTEQYDVTTGHYYEKQDGEISIHFPKQKLRGKGKLVVVMPDDRVIEL